MACQLAARHTRHLRWTAGAIYRLLTAALGVHFPYGPSERTSKCDLFLPLRATQSGREDPADSAASCDDDRPCSCDARPSNIHAALLGTLPVVCVWLQGVCGPHFPTWLTTAALSGRTKRYCAHSCAPAAQHDSAISFVAESHDDGQLGHKPIRAATVQRDKELRRVGLVGCTTGELRRVLAAKR